MKKLVLAALLALPLFAVSARAEGWLGLGCCGPAYYKPSGCLGPWYLYWPMEAHFQSPAPTGYPYWPAPMGLPPGGDLGCGAPAPGNFQPASFQPVGYYTSPPSYWSR